MSETSEPPVDLRALLARIDRDLMELAKLREESRKLNAEEAKLRSEARKLDRDRWIAPWLAITGLVGGVVTVGGAIWRLLDRRPIPTVQTFETSTARIARSVVPVDVDQGIHGAPLP